MAVLPTNGTVFDLYSTANRGMFISAQFTGDAGEESITHNLGRTPVAVWVVIDDNNGGIDIPLIYGTHTSTVVIITAPAGVVYRVMAF